ncbi:hypothetical protein CHS0354_017471 [Potamilus streckersoni]|uniref:RecQ-mediated genome instability protein 1 n=1 Tax=Potamilus streckersoni TaxID=2493646 RepID=A0AAE0TIJ8_9BIVA|nr:hypothetical protein CHS0354_017471 [Potamilus streckersoni]
MNILASAQSWLKSQCIFVPEDWLHACIEWIQEENQEGHLPQQQLYNLVYEQWLLSDLHELQTSCLPEGLSGIAKFHLKGTFALQIDSVVDVSKSFYSQLQDLKGTFNTNSLVSADEPTQKPWEPKQSQMLKLNLTDGSQTVQGMEYQPLKQLSRDIRPGTKVFVQGDVLCRHGVLMLREHNIRVLGGEVDTQIEANTPVSILEQAMELGAANAGKIHRQEFEGGEIKSSKQSLSTRGVGKGSLVKPVDCSPDSLRGSRNAVSVQNVNKNVKKEQSVEVKENLDDQWDDEFNYDAIMDDFEMENFDEEPTPTPPQEEMGAIKPVRARMVPTVMNQPYEGIMNHPKTILFTPNTVDDSYKGSNPTNGRENNLNNSRINGPRNTSFIENCNRVNSRSSTRTGNDIASGAVINRYERGASSIQTEKVESDLGFDDDFDLDEMDAGLNSSSSLYSRNATGSNVLTGYPEMNTRNPEMNSKTSVKVDVAKVKSETDCFTTHNATVSVQHSSVVHDNKTSNAMSSSKGVNPGKSSSGMDMNQTKPGKKRCATTLHHFFTPSKVSRLDDIKCEADDDFQNPSSTSTPISKACRVEKQAERELEAKSLKPPLIIPADSVPSPVNGVKEQQHNQFDFDLDLDRVVFNPGSMEKSPERPFTYLLEVVKHMESQAFLKSLFKVKAYISTLTSKLSLKEDQWCLSCKLNDGTSSLVVDLSNRVLTQLIGFSGQDSMEMRKRAKFDPGVKDVLIQGLQQCQQKLIDLMCIMEVETSTDCEKPVVIALIPISSEHIQALYRCVSCKS